jgi:hypothetical protein
MRMRHSAILLSVVALFALLLSRSSPHFILAKTHSQQRSSPTVSGTALPAVARMVAMQTVDLPHLAHRTFPLSSGGSSPGRTSPSSQPPPLTGKFQGIAESDICQGSCEPPDLALAASAQWVLEGVNGLFKLYDTSGVLQPNWPMTPDELFRVPDPGSCAAPAGAHLTDPRAFYDPNDGRFWAAILEIEGVGFNSCPQKSLYHIAVSQTSDPRGRWTTYAIDISLGTTNVADYTQFGFDQQAVYISANMYTPASAGAFVYAEIFAATKSKMEQGQVITFYGRSRLAITASRTVLVDTVQPVEVEESPTSGPRGGLFIQAFNGGRPQRFNGDPFGDDCLRSACHGLGVWSLTNPGTPSSSISFAFVNTQNYILPPLAQQSDNTPTNSYLIDTGDTRISGTPPYHKGLISFTLNTRFEDSVGHILSAIFWGQVAPALKADGTLASASLAQQGIVQFPIGTVSVTSVYYGTLMPDAAGNLFMVFDLSGDIEWPVVAYVSHRTTDPPGSFDSVTNYLRPGDAQYTTPCLESSTTTVHVCHWGDYTATSYDGTATNNVWFAGQYASADHEWSTYIGKTKF